MPPLIGVGADAALSQPVSAGAAQRSALNLVHGIAAISPLGVAPGAPTGGPATLVDPFDGTGIGPTNPGNVSEYPGASVPLGMVQFSPDTSPDREVTTGSGYDYADTDISGFSLTHLSGPGCAIYGDIPILPVVGAGARPDPDTAIQPFSHADERASAGNYAVSLGRRKPGQRIGVRLTATTRTALGAFTFPAPPGGGTAATDDLLFKVSDSANGSTASQVHVVGPDELSRLGHQWGLLRHPGQLHPVLRRPVLPELSPPVAHGRTTWWAPRRPVPAQRARGLRGLGEVPVNRVAPAARRSWSR